MSRTAPRLSAALLAAAVLALAAAPAAADVRYDFTAFSSFDFGDPPDQYSGSFSLTVPDFIVPNADFQVSSLSSCSAFALSGAAVSCGQQSFLIGYSEDRVTVGFGVLNVATIFYYFQPGAFSAVGSYDTVLFDSSQAGHLSVSSVPEPATWASLGLGLAALGGLLSRRRRPGPAR